MYNKQARIATPHYTQNSKLIKSIKIIDVAAGGAPCTAYILHCTDSSLLLQKECEARAVNELFTPLFTEQAAWLSHTRFQPAMKTLPLTKRE